MQGAFCQTSCMSSGARSDLSTESTSSLDAAAALVSHNAAPVELPTPLQQPAPSSEAGPAPEVGGRGGLDPTRYGDWEKNGRCIDF